MPKTSVVGHLIHKAEPRPDVSDALRLREVADGVQVLGKWLYRGGGDPEACEIDLLLAELEFVGVEDDAGIARQLSMSLL